jgi:hypothetical protein
MRPPLEVTISGPRGDEWERVCGTRQFPVTTWEPIRANLPGKPNSLVWMMNLQLMDSDTLAKIVAHLSQKFGIPVQEIEAEMAAHGNPILAEDAFVVLNDPQRWVG